MASSIALASTRFTLSSTNYSAFSLPAHNFLSSSPSSTGILFTCRLSCISSRPPRFHFFPPLKPISQPASPTSFISPPRRMKQLCRAEEYVFPDPIPEFAEAETNKFRSHLHEKLSKKDIFGDSVEEVVGVCTEILSKFLHTEYGGPGTLLVIPFIDMADTVNERGLPGGPQAARAAVVWAQKYVDKDWNEWTGGSN